MSIQNLLVIMDMESGGCEKAVSMIIDFSKALNAKINVLVVLESVKKAEDIAISFGMPFDINMKNQSIERTADKLKHMFPKEVVNAIYVNVGYFDQEAKNVFDKVNPDMIVVACNNFNKNISKFTKSLKKPILLIN